MKIGKYVLTICLVLMMLLVACNPENSVKTFKVNYIGADGKVFDTHVVEEGKMDTPPSELKRTGYTLIGWSLTECGENHFDFSIPITGDITLYPLWVEGVAVSFYDGPHLIETMYCVEGKDYEFPRLEDYLGVGFTLANWTKDGSPVEGTFTVSYSVKEYNYFAYITTDLLEIDDEGAVKGTDKLRGSEEIIDLVIPCSIEGKTVKSIKDQAFNHFMSLKSVTIPNPVTFIGNGAFSSCEYLRSVFIPASVTSVGRAFGGCTNLLEIVVSEENEHYTSIDGVLFDKNIKTLILYPSNKKISEYTIPDSVTSLKEYSFYYCSNLESITIPKGVTSIGEYAFFSCRNLASVNIPVGVTSIKEYTFANCYALTTIIIPNSVSSIGSGAFSQCDKLKTIEIPNSVSSIEYDAFRQCTSLESISIPNSVSSIGDYAFSQCTSLKSINIPSSVSSIGNGVFIQCTSLESIDIPSSVTTIGSGAFSQCDKLKTIDIPNSVSSIESDAFRQCTSLESIDIPSSVTTIGSCAFNQCTSLESIDIPSSVSSIGSYTFSYCDSLTSINIDRKDDGTLTGAPWGASETTIVYWKE